ncbi:hypothetical protein [Flagellimonas meridianipacifica]|uniref:Secreted protein n=1 Tax=Flagellimonas meridianipacifica TaxID=1080225 RepID=A0A2T0MEX3_9FLAO|nr:hypothetical protein [Allomuricauda pacifica]PRX56118.1 hypothetical protein CLV81_0110 [Allomuricauda pacifica]
MQYKKQIGKNIVALLLALALMAPAAIRFFHMFEGHEHITCAEKVTHIHETVTKCEICNFHLTSIDYDLIEYPDLLLSRIFEKVHKAFVLSQFHSFNRTNTQLRAPPFFC